MSKKQTQQKKIKYWNIELDGIDKSGKSTLCKYITQLSNYRFALSDRGYMTQVAYAKKFGRPYDYELPSKKTIYVLLEPDKKEHEIRCKITNEPEIDYDKDVELFREVFRTLVDKQYKCLKYNTSDISFYYIAKDIIAHIDSWEARK